jgi:ubiquinone/menaquinone biosynthesis C-methylase UbiE
MALTKTQLRDLYRRRAANYDVSANLYYLIGFRELNYRKHAVLALDLKRGDTAVEVGCGTGLNFRYLLAAIGETGRLIGVDLTDAMLDKARQRINRTGWRNVELVEADAAAYSFPVGVQGVLSTFALTLIPEYEQVIDHAARALAVGGRFVLADFKKPDKWPLWLVNLGVLITRPFGVSLDLTERRPWEAMSKYFSHVTMTELFGGAVYIAVGEKS